MALAAGVSPRLRPLGPRAIGRQGGPRGLSTGCSRPDRTQEAAEAEAAPGEPGEGDGSVVNGEGSGGGSQAATPLSPGDGRARGAGRGRALFGMAETAIQWRAAAQLL